MVGAVEDEGFECQIAISEPSACGTGYYRIGDSFGSGSVDFITLDCSGLLLVQQECILMSFFILCLGSPLTVSPFFFHFLIGRALGPVACWIWSYWTVGCCFMISPFVPHWGPEA